MICDGGLTNSDDVDVSCRFWSLQSMQPCNQLDFFFYGVPKVVAHKGEKKVISWLENKQSEKNVSTTLVIMSVYTWFIPL